MPDSISKVDEGEPHLPALASSTCTGCGLRERLVALTNGTRQDRCLSRGKREQTTEMNGRSRIRHVSVSLEAVLGSLLLLAGELAAHSVPPQPPPFAPPTGLEATALRPSRVDLSWVDGSPAPLGVRDGSRRGHARLPKGHTHTRLQWTWSRHGAQGERSMMSRVTG